MTSPQISISPNLARLLRDAERTVPLRQEIEAWKRAQAMEAKYGSLFRSNKRSGPHTGRVFRLNAYGDIT